MKILGLILVAAALVLGAHTPAFAGDTDPLFVNMTTNDSHRAKMAIMFSKAQQGRGHPVTVFLNDKGVVVGAKANAQKFAEQQKTLSEIISKGGVVIICPMCMQRYGVKEADLLQGIQIGNPDLTGSALFKDNTKTLTW